MRMQALTEEQEIWLEQRIKPAPTVFILAYAGGGVNKWWRLVAMLTEEEFLKKNMSDWESFTRSRYRSAMLVKIYRANNSKKAVE